MEKNTSSSVQDALPSTSTAASKKQVANNSLPHIIALPKNPQTKSNMRILQLAPIKCLPKGNINLIKLDASTAATLINMKVLQTKEHQAAIQNLKPIQLKIPINKSAPQNHTPILTISPTNSVPVISTQIILNNSPSSAPKNFASKQSPTKKYQPTILQRKVTPTKSKEVSSIQAPENVSEGNTKKSNSSTIVNVKEILRKVRNRRAREKKLENKDATHVTKRKKSKKSLKEQREKKDTTVSEEMLYVADGFRADVENLMEKCSHVYKLNFEKFTDIWKEMRFSRIFHGRQSGAELAEFTEEAIYIAKSYMVAKSVSFEENIAGLFLVYALLNLQPFPGFAPLRLVPSDVASVVALESGARRQRRHDVLYVLANVLVRGPTHAHVCTRETGFELPVRKYYDGTMQVSEAVKSVFTRNADCVRQLRQLVQLEQRYHGVRQRLQADKIRNLCSQPAASLLRAYHEHIPSALHLEPTTQIHPEPVQKETDARIDLMKSIRDRAMANVVDSMRHLTGVEERLHELSSSSDEEPSPRRGVTFRETKRSQALSIQSLFAAPKHKAVEPLTPSNKEMPKLDGFGESGSHVTISSVNPNNDDSNNNSRPETHILRDLLEGKKRKYEDSKHKKGLWNQNKRQLVDEESNASLIEVEALESIPKVKKKYLRKKTVNAKKRHQEKDSNRSNDDLNTNELVTSSNEQLAENTTNIDAENGVQNMTREEEINYLRAIIEEIEGSIEQDPTQLVTDKQKHSQNNRKIIEIETVECEFVDTPKTAKRKMESDSEQFNEKKSKTEPKKNKNNKDSIKGDDSKTAEVDDISNEKSSSDSTMNKTPKAKARKSDKKSSLKSPANETTFSNTPKTPKNINRQNVTSPKTYVSSKKRNTQLKSPKNVAGSVISPNTYALPKIVAIKSLSSLKRDKTDNKDTSEIVDVKSISPQNKRIKSLSPNKRKISSGGKET